MIVSVYIQIGRRWERNVDSAATQGIIIVAYLYQKFDINTETVWGGKYSAITFLQIWCCPPGYYPCYLAL